MKREDADLPVYLAVEKDIYHPLLERLGPAAKARIAETVPEDLTKVNGHKLLTHFRHRLTGRGLDGEAFGAEARLQFQGEIIILDS